MSMIAAKLFRDPDVAERATDELKAKGYKAEELGILMRKGDNLDRFGGKTASKIADLPGVGPVVATGPVAAALSTAGGGGAIEGLGNALGITEEALAYYQQGLSLGSVLVTVQSDEARILEARRILRSVEAKFAAERNSVINASPGFKLARRMTETDSLDARMSGDFRQY